MRIIIPTRGRYDLTLTCDRLPKELRGHVDIVCPEKEAHRHRDIRPWAHVVVQPDPDFTIAAKRAWIMLNWESDRIVMLDDDLNFFVKRDEDPKKLRKAELADISGWFSALERKLSKDVPHAGFGSRLFNNAKEPGWQTAKRMQYVLGYYLPIVRKVCEFGRIETREDMDYTLQLLRAGYPNEVCHTIAVEQSNEYGARGGCSGQRTTESSDRDCQKLADFHPGLVRVVQKDYKGNPRSEVVVRWEAALREGQERRGVGARRDQARAKGKR